MSRALLLAGVSALLGVVAAGCGGSKSPSVASLGPAATTTTSGASLAPGGGGLPKGSTADFVKFAHCMQQHGIQAEVGQGGHGISINGGSPNSPQFQSAIDACRKDLPGGGPPQLTPAEQAEYAKAMARFAACMRTHGVPGFPDPNAQGMFTPGEFEKLDPTASFFQSAFKACGSLQGKVGPRIVVGR